MKKLCGLMIWALFAATLVAQTGMQQTIASAGGQKSSPGGAWSIGWTLGETIVSSFRADDGTTLLSGMQQQVVISDVESTPEWDVDVSLFPNPVGSILTIKLNEVVNKTISLSLFDVNGRIILAGRIDATEPEKKIDMEAYPSGIYLLRLIDGVNAKTYKVVKL